MIKADLAIQSGKTTLKAFMARPADGGPNPAVVVIHEIVGLSDHIKDITCRLAEQGYVALALDLFSAENMFVCIYKSLVAVRKGGTDHAGVRYLQSGLDYLSEQPYVDATKMGAIGFCMGGNFALSLACQDRRIKTIAPYYCITPGQLEVSKLCPVVGSYPKNDPTFRPGEKLKEALDKTTIPHDIKIYPDTTHCFMNDRLPMLYNADAAKDSWRRTMEFFDQYLRQ